MRMAHEQAVRLIPLALDELDEGVALKSILEGTSRSTGEDFFWALVEHLCGALDTHAAMLTEYLPEKHAARTLAFVAGEKWIHDFEYNVAGTPCQEVLEGARFVHYPENIQAIFPEDQDVKDLGVTSYMGVPLTAVDGSVLGHLAVLDVRPMPRQPRGLAVFEIFAARATAEIQRLHAERALRDREAKLARLVGGAMDAIVEVDDALCITLLNPAAETIFGKQAERAIGTDFGSFLTEPSRAKLMQYFGELTTRPEGKQSVWAAGGLTAIGPGGKEFPAEATISRCEVDRRSYYTLIMRNVNDRLKAEKQIQALTSESEYLQEELKSLQNFGQILGKSPKLKQVLDEVAQVAPTDAAVLILGETGTGKELIARAIHQSSPRRSKALIKINCGAMPSNLIESELFGHEEGAFTGATKQRLGRFALADKGTIFLDEVGDLPLDLQVKLLRVLQEGEFEPVGSSETVKVDVRIIAATNRELEAEVEQGNFRSDLFYRLNVFPISMPPLRERGDDIVLLAQAFAEQCAKRFGKDVVPFDEDCKRRLKAYAWPGNVRELQNIIERVVITSRDGTIDLSRCLPLDDVPQAAPESVNGGASPERRIRTVAELQDEERRNIELALEAAGWKVAGETGAAALLGMNPSTLNSRMRALGIKRPS